MLRIRYVIVDCVTGVDQYAGTKGSWRMTADGTPRQPKFWRSMTEPRNCLYRLIANFLIWWQFLLFLLGVQILVNNEFPTSKC